MRLEQSIHHARRVNFVSILFGSATSWLTQCLPQFIRVLACPCDTMLGKLNAVTDLSDDEAAPDAPKAVAPKTKSDSEPGPAKPKAKGKARASGKKVDKSSAAATGKKRPAAAVEQEPEATEDPAASDDNEDDDQPLTVMKRPAMMKKPAAASAASKKSRKYWYYKLQKIGISYGGHEQMTAPDSASYFLKFLSRQAMPCR